MTDVTNDASQHPASSRRTLLIALALSIALFLVSWFDRDIWRLAKVEDFARIEKKDWYAALRIVGYLPTWLVLAALLLMHDRSRARDGAGSGVWISRAASLALSPAIGGGLAELLKVIVRRQRPGSDGLYRFAWLGEGKGPGWGMASSHVGVAFGGACMVGVLFPSLRIPALLVACGCGWTRVMSGAHFASDVLVGAALGWLAARATARLCRMQASSLYLSRTIVC